MGFEPRTFCMATRPNTPTGPAAAWLRQVAEET
jgi:hypothetical protein